MTLARDNSGSFNPEGTRRRALQIYAEADAAVQNDFQQKSLSASCVKGCAGCCYVLVSVSLGEAVVLAQHVLQSRPRDAVDALLARLDEDRKIFEQRAPSGGYLTLQRACTFLADIDLHGKWTGMCSVYEHRPLTCRFHFVASPPSLCAPDTPAADLHFVRPSSQFRELIAERIAPGGNPFFTQIGPLPVMVGIAIRWLRDGITPGQLELQDWTAKNNRWALRDRSRSR